MYILEYVATDLILTSFHDDQFLQTIWMVGFLRKIYETFLIYLFTISLLHMPACIHMVYSIVLMYLCMYVNASIVIEEKCFCIHLLFLFGLRLIFLAKFTFSCSFFAFVYIIDGKKLGCGVPYAGGKY